MEFEIESEDPVLACTSMLSVAELGLGSFLHACHIPFSGQLLAINQCLLISCALYHKPDDRKIPLKLSTTAALVKAATPFGKRLTPMLAITMQGIFYRAGLIFGTGRIGRATGGALLALWAFIQPALLYGWIFGTDLLRMADYANQFLGGVHIGWVIGGAITLKMIACALAGLCAEWVPLNRLVRLHAPLAQWIKKLQPKKDRSLLIRVFSRLGSWPFLLSMGLAFFYYASLLGSYSQALRLWTGVLVWALISFLLLEAYLLPFALRRFQRTS